MLFLFVHENAASCNRGQYPNTAVRVYSHRTAASAAAKTSIIASDATDADADARCEQALTSDSNPFCSVNRTGNVTVLRRRAKMFIIKGCTFFSP